MPRFLRAFNEALVASTDAHNQSVDFVTIAQRFFAEQSQLLLQLRETITTRLNEFKDYWLVVDRNGDFYEKTRDRIGALLITQTDTGINTYSRELASQIIAAFRKDVDELLGQVLAEFTQRLKPAVLNDIHVAQQEWSNGGGQISIFLDLLQTNTLAAFDEVSSWLGLVKVETDVPDFEVMDLVKFETVSLIFSDFNKLRVHYSSLARKDQELVRLKKDHKLSGAYFEPIQEIIHNVLSNAYRHSGLSTLNTEIDISLAVDRNDVVLRCSNNFSDKNRQTIIEEIPKVLSMLRDGKRDLAKSDSKSGFFKIINVCSRVFGAEPVVNIPPISQRTSRFVVEVRIANAASEMVVR